MSLAAVITAAAVKVGVPPALLLSVCFAESSLRNIHTPNDGGSASYGVCQVKLATARMFSPLVHPTLLSSPETNAVFAALYLKKQMKRYKNWKKAVAAYNAGSYSPHKLSLHNKYVAKVSKAYITRPWRAH